MTDTSSKLFRGGIGVSQRQMRQARKAVWMGGNNSGEGIIRLARPGRTFPRWQQVGAWTVKGKHLMADAGFVQHPEPVLADIG